VHDVITSTWSLSDETVITNAACAAAAFVYSSSSSTSSFLSAKQNIPVPSILHHCQSRNTWPRLMNINFQSRFSAQWNHACRFQTRFQSRFSAQWNTPLTQSMWITDSRMLCCLRSCLQVHPVDRFDSEGWFSFDQVIFLKLFRVFWWKKHAAFKGKTQFPGFLFLLVVQKH